MSGAEFTRMRVWAMLTGLVLAVWYLAGVWSGDQPGDLVPMLVSGIGGFEAFLFGQELWLRRRGREHG